MSDYTFDPYKDMDEMLERNRRERLARMGASPDVDVKITGLPTGGPATASRKQPYDQKQYEDLYNLLNPTQEPTDEQGLIEKWGPPVARGAGMMIGFTPARAVGGAALGELAAQGIEAYYGNRDTLGVKELAAAALTGGLGGKLATSIAAAKGAKAGAIAAAPWALAQPYAHRGVMGMEDVTDVQGFIEGASETPLSEVAVSGAGGIGAGAAVGALHKFLGGRTPTGPAPAAAEVVPTAQPGGNVASVGSRGKDGIPRAGAMDPVSTTAPRPIPGSGSGVGFQPMRDEFGQQFLPGFEPNTSRRVPLASTTAAEARIADEAAANAAQAGRMPSSMRSLLGLEDVQLRQPSLFDETADLAGDARIPYNSGDAEVFQEPRIKRQIAAEQKAREQDAARAQIEAAKAQLEERPATVTETFSAPNTETGARESVTRRWASPAEEPLPPTTSLGIGLPQPPTGPPVSNVMPPVVPSQFGQEVRDTLARGRQLLGQGADVPQRVGQLPIPGLEGARRAPAMMEDLAGAPRRSDDPNQMLLDFLGVSGPVDESGRILGGYAGPERRAGARRGVEFRGQTITPDQPIPNAMDDLAGAARLMMAENPAITRQAEQMRASAAARAGAKFERPRGGAEPPAEVPVQGPGSPVGAVSPAGATPDGLDWSFSREPVFRGFQETGIPGEPPIPQWDTWPAWAKGAKATIGPEEVAKYGLNVPDPIAVPAAPVAQGLAPHMQRLMEAMESIEGRAERAVIRGQISEAQLDRIDSIIDNIDAAWKANPNMSPEEANAYLQILREAVETPVAPVASIAGPPPAAQTVPLFRSQNEAAGQHYRELQELFGKAKGSENPVERSGWQGARVAGQAAQRINREAQGLPAPTPKAPKAPKQGGQYQHAGGPEPLSPDWFDPMARYTSREGFVAPGMAMDTAKEASATALRNPATGEVFAPDLSPARLKAMIESGDPKAVEAAQRLLMGAPEDVQKALLSGTRGNLRKGLKSALERFLSEGRIGGEAGQLDPRLAAQLGLAAGGALTGAIADPFDDPVMSAISMGAIGAAIPAIIPKIAELAPKALADKGTSPEVKSVVQMMLTPEGQSNIVKDLFNAAPHVVRANLLYSPNLPINSVVGPWSAGFWRFLERHLSGDVRGTSALQDMLPQSWMREFFGNPEIAADIIRTSEGAAGERIGAAIGPEANRVLKTYTETPGVWMATGDVTTRKIAERHGFAPLEAREFTLTGEPELPITKGLLDAQRRSGAAGQMLTPFFKTLANLTEAGSYRTPILGEVAQMFRENPDPLNVRLIQQAIGGTLGLGGYAAGSLYPTDSSLGMGYFDELRTLNLLRNFLSNAAGPYALPVSMGFAAGLANQDDKSPGMQARAALVEGTQNLPLPSWDVPMSYVNALTRDEFSFPENMPQGSMPSAVKGFLTYEEPRETRKPRESRKKRDAREKREAR